jgi:hypothetical protein
MTWALIDDLMAWVAGQSMASRGNTVRVVNNIERVADWINFAFLGSFPKTTVVESPRYPKPGALVVSWQTVIPSDEGFGNGGVPLPTCGYPVTGFPVGGANQTLMLVFVEWTVGGARFQAIADASGGSLSIGPADWCRVSYAACLSTDGEIEPFSGTISAAIVPSNIAGLKAHCTSMFSSLSFGTPIDTLLGGQPFSRNWTMRQGNENPDLTANEVRGWPLVSVGLPNQAETISFPTFAGGIGHGIVATNAVWVPHSTSPVGYAVYLPSGQPDTIVKVMTEIQVC